MKCKWRSDCDQIVYCLVILLRHQTSSRVPSLLIYNAKTTAITRTFSRAPSGRAMSSTQCTKPSRPTRLASSRTATWRPSMPGGSPSCPTVLHNLITIAPPFAFHCLCISLSIYSRSPHERGCVTFSAHYPRSLLHRRPSSYLPPHRNRTLSLFYRCYRHGRTRSPRSTMLNSGALSSTQEEPCAQLNSHAPPLSPPPIPTPVYIAPRPE